MNISVVKENIIKAGRRILKVVEFGAKTGDVVAAFGDDSAPLKDMIALYAQTSESGDAVILGYLNKNQIAALGEKRIFSLKQDGSLSFAIHLKNDGTCEIGGDNDFAVRYNELETGFNQLKSDFNTFVQQYNLHQHTAPNGASPPTTQATQSNADISQAKIETIKVP